VKRFVVSDTPPPEVLDAVAEMIDAGGVVILPTDTIYGLHCSATNEEAVETIFRIKERERGKPLLVLANSIAQVRAIGAIIDDDTETLLSSIWPAPLTAILGLQRPIAASAGTSSLAVRIPALPWLRALCERCGPLTSTSVNVTGETPLYSMKSLPDGVTTRIAAVVDAGPREGVPSTLVDFTSAPPKVLRAGAFHFSQNLWKSPRKSL
jgi:L-threonylcarbamoyladenylate synthase